LQANSEKLAVKEKIGYALGDTAANFIFQTMVMFQLVFYTDTFGITAAAAGTLLVVVRVWDAIFDPIMTDPRTTTGCRPTASDMSLGWMMFISTNQPMIMMIRMGSAASGLKMTATSTGGAHHAKPNRINAEARPPINSINPEPIKPIEIVNGVKRVVSHLLDVPKQLVTKVVFDQGVRLQSAMRSRVGAGCTPYLAVEVAARHQHQIHQQQFVVITLLKERKFVTARSWQAKLASRKVSIAEPYLVMLNVPALLRLPVLALLLVETEQ